MIPKFTKHYTLGLIVGMGLGFFLSGLLVESGVGFDASSRRLLGAIGMVAVVIGGLMYWRDLRV